MPSLASRFLVMTADTVSGEAKAWIEAAGLPHICKPFNRKELLERVAEVLARVGKLTVRAGPLAP